LKPADRVLVTVGADDWPLWRQARVAALADSPDAFPRARDDWAAGGEDRWWERLLDPSSLKVVAVDDDEPVGLVRGVRSDGTVWLHSLWVSPRVRGQGVADQLVGAVEEWARPRATYVRLTVVPSNAPAIALYRRHGYVDSATRGKSLPGGGHELMMEKPVVTEASARGRR
jgi:ribosomal protein S18 acetylase RimI-like enzyme